MDDIRADALSKKLVGKAVAGWKIEKYLGCGKSAAVFYCSNGGFEAALKVFDNEIIDRFGRDSQLKRIEREKNLRGKHHPNLVKIDLSP